VRASLVIGAVLLAATVASVAALARATPQQYPGGFRGGGGNDAPPDMPFQGNTPYDGRLVFVRLRYEDAYSRRRPFWSHDYPRGELHFSKILNEVTLIRPRLDGSNILSLDDPQLFEYPIAYMAEPGHWTMTDKEVENFRAYLKKGGFVIFDDFRERDGAWINLQDQMRRVLPEARWIDIGDGSQTIWHAFFEIKNPMALEPHPTYAGWGLHPTYWGIFENNDPSKRLMVIADVDGDISEYWEWSGTGFAPVNLDNEAYKYGINYFIYGITH
jgi:hypothetical protein